jgi:hypothetical protein
MISSIESFSMIFHCSGRLALNIFLVIEKGFETGVAISFGGLFVSFGEPGQKGQDLIWGDGFQFSVMKFV